MGKDKTASKEILYITEGAIRNAQETTDCIIETATEKVIIIDHAKKEYSETSISEIAAAFEKFMPKNRLLRKIVTRIFSNLKIKNGKTSRNIAGYDCNSYLIWIGEVEYEFWATSKLQPPASYYIVMEKLFALMGPMGNLNSTLYAELQKRNVMLLATNLLTMRVGAMDIIDGVLNVFENAHGAMYGIPMSHKELKATKLHIDTMNEATEVKTEPISASTFEVPAGYVKTDSPYKVELLHLPGQ
ncbi:MAG: DUF4412 domain-containing protein [Bacteroidales bacterium]|nr:DUF4412 domain-containing protein [Bacteroidales bacterium]